MAKKKPLPRKGQDRTFSRDERVSVDADPEDALRALVKPRPVLAMPSFSQEGETVKPSMDLPRGGTVAGMEPAIALRLAATAEGVDGVSVDLARLIVRTALTELARCPVCADRGTVTLRSEVVLKGLIDEQRVPLHNAHVPADREQTCVLCGGLHDGNPRGDPAYVAWVCFRGIAADRCELEKVNGDAAHKRCGFHLAIPPNAFDPDKDA